VDNADRAAIGNELCWQLKSETTVFVLLFTTGATRQYAAVEQFPEHGKLMKKGYPVH